MTYLLADSGSTKTDWCLTENGIPVLKAQTTGINPVYQTEEEIKLCISHELLPKLERRMPQALHFYGAGCATPALTEKVRGVLRRLLCPNCRTVCKSILSITGPP